MFESYVNLSEVLRLERLMGETISTGALHLLVARMEMEKGAKAAFLKAVTQDGALFHNLEDLALIADMKSMAW